MRSPTGSRDGLIWDDNGLGPVARWARQPQIEVIDRVCRRALRIDDDDAARDHCIVTFHCNGDFSKLYNVDTIRGKYMMRISLPVDPRNKTRAEALTLRLVHRSTDIPVPKVIAFQDFAGQDELGFEWLLMECIPGKPAYCRWRKMTDTQKEALTKRVAEFHSQLFRCGNLGRGFRSIGTLGTLPESDNHSTNPEPGPIVDPVFFAGPRYSYPIPRGPFHSSHDWLRAYLNLIISEHSTALAKAQTQDDKDHAEMVLRLARKLMRLVHKVFPSLLNPAENTVLWHDDLSLKNIMVDDQGKVTGVIGWECVSALPRWMACQMPAFLRGAGRTTKPDRQCYTNVSQSQSSTAESLPSQGQEDDEWTLDNEGKTELYWIHLMEYEQTNLRKIYYDRMRQLRPEWDKEVEESELKVDFLGAVSRCGTQFYPVRVEQWADAIERREFVSLMHVLRMGINRSVDQETVPGPQSRSGTPTPSFSGRVSTAGGGGAARPGTGGVTSPSVTFRTPQWKSRGGHGQQESDSRPSSPRPGSPLPVRPGSSMSTASTSTLVSSGSTVTVKQPGGSGSTTSVALVRTRMV
ncbi:phosphotransferase enzyme family-domain-containing protein [Cladorrhinum sp. PSN259]|nr:phosphotransferase enzyme family-domain-containing protein [Cladorrhinum sp. PSN259]